MLKIYSGLHGDTDVPQQKFMLLNVPQSEQNLGTTAIETPRECSVKTLESVVVSITSHHIWVTFSFPASGVPWDAFL